MRNANKKIAVIFDFDDTLADDSTSSFLDSIEVDVQDFWARHLKLLNAGWDPMPAYLQMMLELSREEDSEAITQKSLANWGKKIKCRPGLGNFFKRIREFTKDHDDKASIHFYIISSGIGEIIRNFRYREQFDDIWACDFSYNRAKEIAGVKNVVSFTDKTRFIFQIQKGITGKKNKGKPFEVNRKFRSEDYYIPLDQMIFIGDGFTDVPCFSLLQKSGGVPIGVYDRDAKNKWGKAWGLMEEKRVSNMVAADFRKQSGLDDTVKFAVRQILEKKKYF